MMASETEVTDATTVEQEEQQPEERKEEVVAKDTETEAVIGDVVEEDEDEEEPVRPPHPYKDQLSEFKPSEKHLAKRTIKTVPSLEDTPYTYVSSVGTLNDMVTKLKEVEEVAVSVEVNYYRSFNEVMSLIQIATYDEHFLVDVMELKEDISVLNEVFTDSEIMKVMHDSSWDLDRLYMIGLYVINLFDTFDTITPRRKAKFLGSMLETSFGVHTFDHTLKKLVWTMRPLTEEMITHSRQKVHYLLHARDKLQNQLIEKKRLELSSFAKKCLAAKIPSGRKFKPLSYLRVYRTAKVQLNKQQMQCFKSIFEWRYRMSESNDESYEYTMPKTLLIEISKLLPKEVEDIRKVCHTVPPLVEEHIEDIKNIVLKAIEDEPDTTTIVNPSKRDAGMRQEKQDKRQKKNASGKHNVNNARGGRGAFNNRGRGAYGNHGRGAYSNHGRGAAYGNRGRGGFTASGRGGAFQGYRSYGGGYGAPFGGQGFSGMGARMGGPNLESIVRTELYNALGNMQQQSGNFGGGYNQNRGGYW